MAYIARWLSSDTLFEVRKSGKREGLHQFFWTSFGVVLSLLGFIAQFTGLRGLNWIVAVAQLGAIGIMCGCPPKGAAGEATIDSRRFKEAMG